MKKVPRMRLLLQQDLDPGRRTRPRLFRGANHPLAYYTSGECLARPLEAFHGIMRWAEHFHARLLRSRRLQYTPGLEPDVASLVSLMRGNVRWLLDYRKYHHMTFRPSDGELTKRLRPAISLLDVVARRAGVS